MSALRKGNLFITETTEITKTKYKFIYDQKYGREKTFSVCLQFKNYLFIHKSCALGVLCVLRGEFLQ
jgi:hypothetical protein